eukprot:gene11699-24508_t
MAGQILKGLIETQRYYHALFEFIVLKRKYKDSTIFDNDLRAKVQVFSLSLIFTMWSVPHYRSKTFQHDLINNLQNVAIPGTGIPLSYFCYSYWTCLFLILVINPFVCFLGAVNKAFQLDNKDDYVTMLSKISQNYIDHLLHPSDWFSYWQLNCRLTSYASLITKHIEFQQENKWTFLTDGKRLKVPVTPFLDIETIVCKNINIEGGLGIHFFKNAAHGGDYIIQSKLKNAEWLKKLLPPTAPLSTMRIITTSTWQLSPPEENK